MSNHQAKTIQGPIPFRSDWFFLLRMTLLIATVSFVLPRQLPLFFSLEHKYADIRTTLLSPRNREQFEDFIFVKITESDLREMEYRSPVDRSWLANLIREIDSRTPSAIGVNLLIDQPTENEKDQELIDTLNSIKSKIVFSGVDKRSNPTPFQKQYSDWFFEQSGVQYGFANFSADQDDVIRLLPQPMSQSSDMSFADAVVSNLSDTVPPISRNEQISWLRDVSKEISPYTELAASFVRDRPDVVDLNGKVVLIGKDIPNLDRHKTPFNVWGELDTGMAGSRIFSQIIIQRMEGRRLRIIPGIFEFFLYFISAFLGLKFALSWRNLKYQNLLFISLNVAVVIWDVLTFTAFSILVPTAMMLLTFTFAFKYQEIIAIFSSRSRKLITIGFSR